MEKYVWKNMNQITYMEEYNASHETSYNAKHLAFLLKEFS